MQIELLLQASSERARARVCMCVAAFLLCCIHCCLCDKRPTDRAECSLIKSYKLYIYKARL